VEGIKKKWDQPRGRYKKEMGSTNGVEEASERRSKVKRNW
jgi:hypothetical protein